MRRKIYGHSKINECTFCDKQATLKNKQGLLVCPEHKTKILQDIKCVCGSYLELKTGRYGPFFVCINCGNINLRKGLEMRDMKPTQQKAKVNHVEKQDRFILDAGKYPDFDYGIK